MPRYVVRHRYGAVRDSRPVGPWQGGQEVELSTEEADWVNRDSAGVLLPAEQTATAADPPASPAVADGEGAGAGQDAAPQPEPDPRPEPDDEPADGPGIESEVDGEVPDGTAQAVLAWVGADPAKARRAADAEKAKGDAARSTLLAALEKLTGDRPAPGGRDRMHRGGHDRGLS